MSRGDVRDVVRRNVLHWSGIVARSVRISLVNVSVAVGVFRGGCGLCGLRGCSLSGRVSAQIPGWMANVECFTCAIIRWSDFELQVIIDDVVVNSDVAFGAVRD